mmetsp:Transcript_3956/g.4563  ORF Transcript_3956/g.4563 Transcript_3956/m.4563 type:complete len:395 (-) Transcript_3956:899-2083(-)
MSDREFDVILYGATGFTGSLVAEYLAKNALKKGLKFAIAGRNEKKLLAVKSSLGLEDLECLIADSDDQEALISVTSKCKVLATTVGPYYKYGKKVVAACVESGTNYCDITGEYPFILESIQQHHEKAKENKIKIVHCCGFDCIPVDMAAFLGSKCLSSPPVKIRALCTKGNGLASGGTLESLGSVKKHSAHYTNGERKDPYVLAPGISDELRVDKSVSKKKGIAYDSTFGTVTFPYFMTSVDNRLVRRSLALRGVAASYDEAMSIGLLTRATGFLLVHLPSAIGHLKPKAGNGPPKAIRNAGSFKLESRLVSEGGETCTVHVAGKGDPGYQATAAMFAEAAMLLADPALDEGASEEDLDHFTGGVLTPSTAMGQALIDRLQESGLFTFTVSKKN